MQHGGNGNTVASGGAPNASSIGSGTTTHGAVRRIGRAVAGRVSSSLDSGCDSSPVRTQQGVRSLLQSCAVAHSPDDRLGRVRGRAICVFSPRKKDIESHRCRPEATKDGETDANANEEVDGGFTHGRCLSYPSHAGLKALVHCQAHVGTRQAEMHLATMVLGKRIRQQQSVAGIEEPLFPASLRSMPFVVNAVVAPSAIRVTKTVIRGPRRRCCRPSCRWRNECDHHTRSGGWQVWWPLAGVLAYPRGEKPREPVIAAGWCTENQGLVRRS
jgi:hypothetical protein